MAPRQAILNLFLWPTHRGSWREPGGDAEFFFDFDLLKAEARLAERGKFHTLFIADVSGLAYADVSRETLRRGAWLLRPEPVALAGALAAATESIGIILTASTTYDHPYRVARAIATLDLISGGRAGWNVVTSHMPAAAPNFGLERMLEHTVRYERAEEFFGIVTGLWDSWEDDAFVRDRESGIFLDPDKLHALDHHGVNFSVAGPLNVPRPLQGYPVIAQAGASREGRAFAARIAELMYLMQTNIDDARAFYTEMKQAAAAGGRSPDSLKILPQLHLVVGRSEAEAQEKAAQLNELVDPLVGLEQLNQYLEFDVSGYPLDGPLPYDDIPLAPGGRSRQALVLKMARDESMTIRQLASWSGSYGVFAGSAVTIADRIEEWFAAEACDGFNLIFANPRESLTNFVDLVVPELQRRGIFRTEYAGRTLRENLGLPRPENRYVESGGLVADMA
jgi:FMN-dependent oxidoreductase (nitrilotriacetate monooxygenase family)